MGHDRKENDVVSQSREARRFAKRMASWRSASTSGLSNPPQRHQVVVNVNLSHPCMTKLPWALPDYIVNHIVEMEAEFVARYSYRYHSKSDDSKLHIGNLQSGPRTLT